MSSYCLRRLRRRRRLRRLRDNRRKRSVTGGAWRAAGTNTIFTRRQAAEMWLIIRVVPHLHRVTPRRGGDGEDLPPAPVHLGITCNLDP